VDRDGNIVALTQAINNFFGSGVVVPGTGILLNNEMNELDRHPGRPNSYTPGKRPLSRMSPMLVLKDNRPNLSIGSAGATRIISALSQVLVNLIDRKMNLQQAINAPRIHWEGDLFMESRIPSSLQEELSDWGYRVRRQSAYDLYFGGVQAVLIDPDAGVLFGAADPRRAGAAIGY
jgi:gamma-glutamyltranspeptidase / glutathione hydrolase